MERWGIIGGTFDPIHYAHLYIAKEAKKLLKLDKIIFMVAGSPPHKNLSRVTRASLRYKMVNSAIENMHGFVSSDYEIKKHGKSYTYHTLEHLKNEERELYFITGADCLIDLEKWREIGRIFKAATLVVFNRPGFAEKEVETKKKLIEDKYNTKIIFLNVKEINESSTLIREKIKNNQDVSDLIPRQVLNIINKEELYRE